VKISSIAQVLKRQKGKENSKSSQPEISIKSQKKLNFLCHPKLEKLNLASLKLHTAQSQSSDRGHL